MSGTTLLMVLLIVVVGLPGSITLMIPVRWLPLWLALLSLVLILAWNDPFDGPGGGLAFFGLLIVSVLNAAVVTARIIKIAFDSDRNQ